MSNRVKLLISPDGKITKPMPLAKYWLQHPQRRQYDGVIFRPLRDVRGYFNLWTGFAVAGVLREVLGSHQRQRVSRR